MRRSIMLSIAACVVAVVVLLFAALISNDRPTSGPAFAQDSDKAPILVKEARSWCVGSCDGGDYDHDADPSEFVMRPDGSVHFESHVNYAACPSFEIPDDVGGWYFGTSRERIESQLATSTATSGGSRVTYETSGVRPIDDGERNNSDLMICEAVFVRGA